MYVSYMFRMISLKKQAHTLKFVSRKHANTTQEYEGNSKARKGVKDYLKQMFVSLGVQAVFGNFDVRKGAWVGYFSFVEPNDAKIIVNLHRIITLKGELSPLEITYANMMPQRFVKFMRLHNEKICNIPRENVIHTTSKTERSFPCLICKDKPFKTPMNLFFHYQQSHAQERFLKLVQEWKDTTKMAKLNFTAKPPTSTISDHARRINMARAYLQKGYPFQASIT